MRCERVVYILVFLINVICIFICPFFIYSQKALVKKEPKSQVRNYFGHCIVCKCYVQNCLNTITTLKENEDVLLICDAQKCSKPITSKLLTCVFCCKRIHMLCDPKARGMKTKTLKVVNFYCSFHCWFYASNRLRCSYKQLFFLIQDFFGSLSCILQGYPLLAQ